MNNHILITPHLRAERSHKNRRWERENRFVSPAKDEDDATKVLFCLEEHKISGKILLASRGTALGASFVLGLLGLHLMKCN